MSGEETGCASEGVAGRALHFVFKIGNRRANYNFFTKVLAMKILRHEEFEEGCKASCNGPYDGKWSKTMVGYGCEDEHFVIELTYNYSIRSYKMGNDFQSILIVDEKVYNSVANCDYDKTHSPVDNSWTVLSPDGYKFVVYNNSSSSHNSQAGPVRECRLNVSNKDTSLKYWNGFLGMPVISNEEEPSVTLCFQPTRQCHLKLSQVTEGVIDHEEAYGRIAFSTPEHRVKEMEERSKQEKYTVLTPFVSLDTPGKATVNVVILADPDGHEICFVGDEGFRDLSKVQPNAEQCLREAIERDKSDEWFEKKKKVTEELEKE